MNGADRSELRLLLLPLLLLLIPFATNAQDEDKPYQGLLWKITGNGLDQPSYLYGTMHVSDKLAYHLSKEFFEGVENCDVVALENNPAFWMEEIMGKDRFPSYKDILSDRVFNKRNMGRSFYEKAFYTERPDEERLSKLLKRDGSLTRRLLFRTNPLKSGNFEESTYLDLFIFRAGRKHGKPVHSLEDFGTSNRMRFKAQDKAKENDERLMEGTIYFDGEERSVQELTRGSYRKGDLKRLDSVMRIASSDAFYQHMLIDRNHIMVETLDSLLDEKSVFAGVGSGHLAGDEGMIELLRERGYELESIPRNFQKKSEKSKEAKKAIEEKYLERSYEPRYSADSVFKVELPGELFTVKELPSIKEYLHPDMVNGIFYQIRRIDTYGGLTGTDVTHQKERLDSLLFENIPGEILERKEVSTDGHPGFHIKNETVRGNIQEYRIVFTPLQILVFKAGGTEDVLEGAPSDSFFSSIEVRRGRDSSWRNFVPEHGGFQVKVPGRPLVYDPSTTDLYKEGRMVLQAHDPETGDHYMLRKTTLHDFDYIEADSFELERLTEKFAEPLDLEVKEKSYAAFRGYPSIEAKLEKENLERDIRLRILIRGGEYYLMLASMNSDEDPSRFMDSFRFQDFSYQRKFEEYRDTALSFHTKTIAPDTVPEHSLAAYRRRIYDKRTKKESEDKWYDEKHQAYGTYKPAEKLQVRLYDMKELAWVEDTSHLWNSSASRLFEDDMALEDLGGVPGEDSTEYYCVHSDTGSTRIIRSRNKYYEGAIYSVLHYTDTAAERSPYVDRFFSSFEPFADTSFGPSIFQDKTPRFFQMMRSGDSARKAKARSQFYLVRFQDEEIDSLMDFLKTYSFDKETKDVKAWGYDRLGWYDDHDGVLPFLKAAYDREEGNSRMRFSILRGLANRDDSISRRAIVELFDRQVPLTNDESRIWNFFNRLDDSLGSAKHVVPDIFKYADFEAYEHPIHDLVAEMVDSGTVEGSVYASYKGSLLRDAQRKLRMQQASSDEEEEGEELTLTMNGKEYDYSTGDGEMSSEEEHLMDYASLLSPFYEEDEEVRAFFEDLRKTSSDPLLLEYSLLRVHLGLEVADSVWEDLAAQDRYRNELWMRLRKMGQEERFPQDLKDQELLARGALYDDLDPENDSVQFLERRKVTLNDREGYVYFFKSKRSYSNEWKLDYTGLQPLNEDRFDLTPKFTETGKGKVRERQDLSELIDEEVEAIRVRDRERVTQGNFLF